MNKEITDISTMVKRREAFNADLNNEMNGCSNEISSIEAEIQEMREKLSNRGENLHSLSEEVQHAKDNYAKLADHKKYDAFCLAFDSDLADEIIESSTAKSQKLTQRRLLPETNIKRLRKSLVT